MLEPTNHFRLVIDVTAKMENEIPKGALYMGYDAGTMTTTFGILEQFWEEKESEEGDGEWRAVTVDSAIADSKVEILQKKKREYDAYTTAMDDANMSKYNWASYATNITKTTV